MKKLIALEKFIKWDTSDSIKNIIQTYPWDPVEWEENIVVKSKNIADVLSRYLEWKVSYEYLVDWADFLELREDVDYEEEKEAVTWEIIHILANPLLEWKLKDKQIRDYIDCLNIANQKQG